MTCEENAVELIGQEEAAQSLHFAKEMIIAKRYVFSFQYLHWFYIYCKATV